MRIPLAIIAEYAVVKPDRSFYIVAGGFDTLPVERFPHTVERLSLALKIVLDPSERASPTAITLRFVGPDDRPFAAPTDVAITPRPQLVPDDLAVVNLVYNLTNVLLPTAGVYSAVMTSGGQQLAIATFQARSAEMPSDAVRMATSYGVAFEKFQTGDLRGAAELFEQLVAENPEMGMAQNALGFVLLSEGDAAAALMHLEEAQRLNAENPELLDVNIACCRYFLGDPRRALNEFDRCLRTHTLPSPAVLLAIKGNGTIPVGLGTAGDYVALVALNAAWSALSASDLQAAEGKLVLCRAGLDLEGAPMELLESLEAAEELYARRERDRDP